MWQRNILFIILCMIMMFSLLSGFHYRRFPISMRTSSVVSMKVEGMNRQMGRFIAGGIVIISNIGLPSHVLADGEANLAFFQKEQIVKVGENLYNENDREIIKEKLSKTKKNW